MEPVKLYVDFISQPSRTVVQFVRLNNIPHQIINIDLFKGEHLKPPFSQKFRIAQVPAIQHGDLKLIQTGAIIPYLGEAFNISNQWWPGDLQARSLVIAFFHWHHSNVRAVTSPYLMGVYVKPKFMDTPIPEGEEEKLREKLNEKMAIGDAYFANHQYVAYRPEASVADLLFYNEIDELQVAGYDFSAFPNLLAWKARIDPIEEVEATREVMKAVFGS